jgi:hypothetical protein
MGPVAGASGYSAREDTRAACFPAFPPLGRGLHRHISAIDPDIYGEDRSARSRVSKS